MKKSKWFPGVVALLDADKDGKLTEKDAKLLARRNTYATAGGLVGVSLGLQKGLGL